MKHRRAAGRQAQDGPPFVAAGAPWFMTLFGRDSLLTAWMALPLDVGVSVGTLQQLAEAQGRRVDPITEEQPGRILHEIRGGPGPADVLGGPIYYVRWTRHRFSSCCSPSAGGGAPTRTSCGPCCPPPTRAGLGETVRRQGRRQVYQIPARHRPWADRPGLEKQLRRRIDVTGHTAGPPMRAGVQGYRTRPCWPGPNWPTRSANPGRRRSCASAPTCCGRGSSTRSGCPSRAVCDRAGRSQTPHRRVDQQRGPCLWTGIAADEHAEVIVDRLLREEMDSGFGLRTLATTMGAYNPMSYHNGSVWPHDTAIAVAGLLRYRHVPGAVPLAERLAIGLLDAGTPLEAGYRSFSAASRDLSSLVRCPIPRHVRRRRGPALRRCCWCAPSSGCTRMCRTAGSWCPRCCRGPGAVSR